MDALIGHLERDLARHPSSTVRHFAVRTLSVSVPLFSSAALSGRALPLLSVLAADTDRAVRIATARAFSAIAEFHGGDVGSMESAANALNGLLEDAHVDAVCAVLRAVAESAPRAEPVFRDEYVLPMLMAVTDASTAIEPKERRDEVLTAIIEAYVAYASICASWELEEENGRCSLCVCVCFHRSFTVISVFFVCVSHCYFTAISISIYLSFTAISIYLSLLLLCYFDLYLSSSSLLFRSLWIYGSG